MSAVLKKSRSLAAAGQPQVKPEIVDNGEIVHAFEKRRKKRMGAVSQILSDHRKEDILPKKTLGA